MAGHVSKASDVYAYGILLYELITGQRAYAGVPVPLLPHEVALQGLRPEWPRNMPAESSMLRDLAEACWQHKPQDRCVCVCIDAREKTTACVLCCVCVHTCGQGRVEEGGQACNPEPSGPAGLRPNHRCACALCSQQWDLSVDWQLAVVALVPPTAAGQTAAVCTCTSVPGGVLCCACHGLMTAAATAAVLCCADPVSTRLCTS